ncbi:DUF4173 domain-containing protein [Clostridium sp. SHJSY1]|uniref:DUF4153 domain-containing protein n=1 Tax=Clostridium sp. SHJSY1 TaxID=2942483 RepID=UPI0028751869|nr:DUF4173 domain-containing protein [Clostridium sp. SHJSY1]MDS0525981.1 DUF4173 domain-containing protein [Clostridium sp. SHJSY1]
MKKNLYILRNRNSSILIYEGEKLKYFEEDGEVNLEELEKYLKGKIEYNYLRLISKKEVVYYREDYRVILIDIVEFKEIKDVNSIRALNKITSKDIDYKDLNLIEIFCSYECRLSNFNNVELNKKEKEDTIKNTFIAIAIALITIIFFIGRDGLNYFGISVPLIVVLTSLMFIFSLGKVKKINITGVYFLIISILLSATYGIFTNTFFRVINIFMIPISLLTGIYMMSFSEMKLSSKDLFGNIFPNVTIGVFNKPHIKKIRKAINGKEILNLKNNKYNGILKGILISIPLLIILTLLLSSADEMFGSIFGNIIASITNTIFMISPKGSISKLIVFIIVFIYLFYLFSSLKFTVKSMYMRKINKLDKSMVNTILVLINILYLIFTYIQIKYLYIKYNRVDLTAEEYSNYARSGFFQLIVVVILNIIIIIYFKSKIDKNKLTCGLNTLMTVISMNMGLTSLYKMNLYIKEFGMTQLRFVTSVFMIFVLIMLIFIAISLWKSIDLFKSFVLIGSIIYLGINFCNMDKLIAEYNLNTVIKEVDMRYLSNLSLDSYDVVLEAFNEGKLDKNDFKKYINQKKITSKWYEYNYYNNK